MQHSMSRHIFLCVVIEFQAYHKNYQQSQAELKAEIEYLSRQRVFCHDITEEECKEDCLDNDQGKWKKNFVATILTLSQHNRMKISR